MTIANAFNEITIAQGGTPNYSGTIAGAIDSLNDALAGSDQQAASTIEGAVRLLGQHIGGGGPVLGSPLTVLNKVDEGEMDFTVTASDDMDEGNLVDIVCSVQTTDSQSMRIAAGLYLALDFDAVVKKVEGTPEVRTTVNPDKTYDDEGVKFYLIPEADGSVYYEASY